MPCNLCATFKAHEARFVKRGTSDAQNSRRPQLSAFTDGNSRRIKLLSAMLPLTGQHKWTLFFSLIFVMMQLHNLRFIRLTSSMISESQRILGNIFNMAFIPFT